MHDHPDANTVTTCAAATAEPQEIPRQQPADRLQVVVKHCGDVLTLTASGVVDADTALRFGEPLRNGGAKLTGSVLINMAEVSSLDTAGVVALLEAARRVKMAGGVLILVPSAAVEQLLEQLELTERFTFHPRT
ncbi:STAS domain-containing protein [Salinifilum ghardaiensis]